LRGFVSLDGIYRHNIKPVICYKPVQLWAPCWV